MARHGYTLGEIVAKLGGELIGRSDQVVHRLASLAHAVEGQISFLSNGKYLHQLSTTKASAVILNPDHQSATDLPRIITDNPYAYFARLSALMNPLPQMQAGRHAGATIDASASVPDSCAIGAHVSIGKGVMLGENVTICPGAVIGDGVTIGAGTWIASNVVIYFDCVIGSRCAIAAGTVIGADGFGYAEEKNIWVKIPQVGRVVIEDDVEIGANTTIDRGALDDTIIEQGCKLDNLIQIGHNCRIGAHTVIAGCVGIAGSAKIGKHCKIGGAAMILGHLEIADGATISPGTMITKSLKKADTYTALMPFQTHEDWRKTAASIRHLSELSDRIKQLENILKSTEKPNENGKH